MEMRDERIMLFSDVNPQPYAHEKPNLPALGQFINKCFELPTACQR